MTDGWTDREDTIAEQAGRIVSGLVRLANDEEARKVLGVDGTLEDELGLNFLDDPLTWIAGEIAGSLDAGDAEGDLEGEDDEDEDADVVSLSTMVAMLRLYRVLRGGTLDERELTEAVLAFLDDEQEAS